jgi:uncharacterized protein YdhG (YjbR/CyaY superfamily)
MNKYKNVDEYILGQEEGLRARLKDIRNLIKEIAPEAEEYIGYGMPGYKLNGPLVYFAAFKNHIGFYPTPNGVEAFQEELSKYKGAKGSVQFPLDQELPMDLIRKIVKYRLKENLAKNKK